MSDIRSIGVEHIRSFSGCWAAFVYREDGWTFRMADDDLDGKGHVMEIVGPDGREGRDLVPLAALSRAAAVLGPLTIYDLSYRSNGHCDHHYDINLTEVDA